MFLETVNNRSIASTVSGYSKQPPCVFNSLHSVTRVKLQTVRKLQIVAVLLDTVNNTSTTAVSYIRDSKQR